MRFCNRLLVTKCPKIPFKIGSLPSCRSRVDTELVCPLILVPFCGCMIHKWFNKKVQGLGLKRSQYPKENCERLREGTGPCKQNDHGLLHSPTVVCTVWLLINVNVFLLNPANTV